MKLTENSLNDLISLARQASSVIMKIYNSNSTEVEYKSDDSPLTQADKLSHEIIVRGLGELFPDIPVVSEEGSAEENAKLVGSPKFWLVDPIDGTKEFVNRTGEFCVAIGLVEDNAPSFGLVAAPTLGAIYYGGKELGSYKIAGDSEPRPISVKTLGHHVIAMSRSHPNEATRNYIDTHFQESKRIPLGSMLKQVKLAEGEIDIYLALSHTMSTWDTAAGHAIIEGAGGHMTRPDGTEIDYSNPSLKVGDFIARATLQLPENL